eukprot:scaffold24628_cov164-Isochrysis_galbana.AAC.1
MCGSWAHHVAFHWAARVAGWQWHGHAQCGRRTGRGSGACVSGLRLHANLKLGNPRGTHKIGGSRNWEDGRSTGKVFSGLRRMSEDSGAGTQPGSCGPQEGIPGASLDSRLIWVRPENKTRRDMKKNLPTAPGAEPGMAALPCSAHSFRV